MKDEISTTRRGFLRGSIGTAGAALVVSDAGCAKPAHLPGETATAPGTAEAGERVSVSTTVNGKAHQLEVHPDDSALDVVRKELHLTGSKLGCGHGACGACTMHLDGTPVVTCLLPATALEGRTVVTVEGLSRGAKGSKSLHPVQRAFMAEDALQCGYCTPGFVVEAAAFHDAWRKQHGTTEPSRDEVAAALSGHLCRCGAYAQIYAAVQGACAGRFDASEAAPRYDAREKVTGAAKYTVDTTLPGMLVAKSLASPHAHAIVTKLDWSKALAVPGVEGAIDLLPESRRVRHAGQEIMALAATDERTAEHALLLVEVEYDVQPAAIGMDAALAPEAPVVYEAKTERKHLPNSSEGPLMPEGWKGNLRGPLRLFSKKRSQARRAIEQAKEATEEDRKGATLVEGTWRTQVQCHTPLEPHVALAQWDGEDTLTVHMSTQAVHHMAEEIAERWGLKEEHVRVLAPYVGGGFGAKATLTTETVIAVELARVCGVPVMYALDRRQELMIGGNRPAAKTEIALVTNPKGTLTAMRSVTHNDSGVAVGGVVGVMHRLVYPEAPREIVDYDVTNHAPAGKPFRGPAGPQAYWALEQAVDEMAHARGEDPVELRKRWDPNPARNALYAWVQALPEWRDRPKPRADRGRYRRGMGLATAAWFSFTQPNSHLELQAGPDGLVASIATQDIGNGTRTTIATVIAQSLGLSMHDVDVRMGDSDYVPGPMAGGSRTTSSVVPPAMHAVAQLKDELCDLARKHHGLSGVHVAEDGVGHDGGVIPWAEVMAIGPKIRVIGRRQRDEGGYYMPPMFGLAIEQALAGSVQVVELEVDTRLGRTRVLRTWGGYGVGRIVSPQLARSQAQGGIIQGISYALYEERRLDPSRGFLLTAGLEDYRVMGIGDVGEIHVHFDETGYEQIRGRSVGLGELVTLAPAAAIGNAMFDATGWRPRELPLRPDRVLKGVRG
ncbi:molybdopterin-dependent oxidoreductase [Paraliomyxa miuraensis]|uniref:molybdopterin-dependent oxidoreductase n=1 Tax=Paraliomyxa miuraensis TaxID=376150 RepID=UPI00224D7B42|nr:molybdopterin-dependent oxidoreductase [Paraliomyxa miuraensis]MCX4239911.1 molybdopterin-dependent oxidoreductase [Paraliomyxa miuraensis]